MGNACVAKRRNKRAIKKDIKRKDYRSNRQTIGSTSCKGPVMYLATNERNDFRIDLATQGVFMKKLPKKRSHIMVVTRGPK